MSSSPSGSRTVTASRWFGRWVAEHGKRRIAMDTSLVIGGKEFASRLIVGTGKYGSLDIMRQAHEESGAEIVTVAIRRVSLPGSGESILDYIDTKRFTLLPNTAGCYTADEAVRTAYLAREAGLGELVKLEVIGDSRTLFPDVQGLLDATKTLARDGLLMNTAIASARDPVAMARAMRHAVEAGRLAYKAGRMPKKLYASASSPLEGLPDWSTS